VLVAPPVAVPVAPPVPTVPPVPVTPPVALPPEPMTASASTAPSVECAAPDLPQPFQASAIALVVSRNNVGTTDVFMSSDRLKQVTWLSMVHAP
jgi:hypothetical protein